MQLSVVILNYNVRYFLELCVLSVQKAIEGFDAEIIVVDNNSTDDSCDMIKRRFPNVILIENKENSGFPKGNNIGVAAAKGNYICILNPDTVVAEDTFHKVLAFAERQKNLGIVGVKLIDGTGNFLPESKRGIPSPWTAFTKIAGLYKVSSKLFGKYYAAHLSENQTGKVEILVGAFMLMKRELYLDVGGFDENCFMYSDDIDLSYTVLKTGRSNYYFHETSVIHYKGESTVRDEKYMKRFQEAMNFFYKKHFGSNPGSFLFSGFMKMGIVFFSLIKKMQGRQKSRQTPQTYCLISDSEALREKLQLILKSDIKRIGDSILTQSFSGNKPSQFIFDNNFISFKAIIGAFETQKAPSGTFRIIPQQSDFMIGSDSSFDRGEVVSIPNSDFM